MIRDKAKINSPNFGAHHARIRPFYDILLHDGKEKDWLGVYLLLPRVENIKYPF